MDLVTGGATFCVVEFVLQQRNTKEEKTLSSNNNYLYIKEYFGCINVVCEPQRAIRWALTRLFLPVSRGRASALPGR
jgi:hypothetical protein